MPYQVFGSRPGAPSVTATCTRSARARSSRDIFAMASRSASSPSAFFAPFLPSARSSAARSFIAARSSALKPSDSVVALVAGICGFLSGILGGVSRRRSDVRSAGSLSASRILIERVGSRLQSAEIVPALERLHVRGQPRRCALAQRLLLVEVQQQVHYVSVSVAPFPSQSTPLCGA